MSAPYEIIWAGEALKILQSILSYLANSWSSREIDQFLEKLEKRETLLSQHPKAFPLVRKTSYRRSVLTNQIAIFYKFDGNHVKIHYLFNTRQDPSTLNLME